MVPLRDKSVILDFLTTIPNPNITVEDFMPCYTLLQNHVGLWSYATPPRDFWSYSSYLFLSLS